MSELLDRAPGIMAIPEDRLWTPQQRELYIPEQYRIPEGDPVFGTDGIRAEFGKSPMDRFNVPQIGLVLALALGRGGKAVVCNDGRFSGEDMTDWIAFGMRQAGVNVEDAEVMSTAGVALASMQKDVDFAVSLSASHNPAADTGVKVFIKGRKLTDEQQEILAEAIRRGAVPPSAMPTGTLTKTRRYRNDYARFLVNSAQGHRFDGQSVLLDTASGAGYDLGEVLTELGFNVTQIDPKPNGHNINDGYGVEHLETLKRYAKEHPHDHYQAHDGDEDRNKNLSENETTGELHEVDGDYAMLAIGAARRAKGTVVTTMTNLGVERAMRASSLAGRPKRPSDVIRAGVGDRQVLAEMERRGYKLGGEQSGHVLILDSMVKIDGELRPFTTGSGVHTAIQYYRALDRLGMTSDDLYNSVERVPQKMVNVECPPGVGTEFTAEDMDALAKEAGLACNGLVSIRRSGTQPLVRINVQSDNAEADAGELEDRVRQKLGLQAVV